MAPAALAAAARCAIIAPSRGSSTALPLTMLVPSTMKSSSSVPGDDVGRCARRVGVGRPGGQHERHLARRSPGSARRPAACRAISLSTPSVVSVTPTRGSATRPSLAPTASQPGEAAGRGDGAEAGAGRAVVSGRGHEHRAGALGALGGDRLGRRAEGRERLGDRREDHVGVVGEVAVAVRVERAVDAREQGRGRAARGRRAAAPCTWIGSSVRQRSDAVQARGPVAADDDARPSRCRAPRRAGPGDGSCGLPLIAFQPGAGSCRYGCAAVDRAVEQRDGHAAAGARAGDRARGGARATRAARPPSRPDRACAPGTRRRPRAPRAAARADPGARSPRPR